MIDLVEDVECLSKRRPVFHSEADFQFSLGWLLKERHPELEVRLEHPRPAGRGAIDIVAYLGGRQALALELKYLCQRHSTVWEGEAFELAAQSAYPLRRYDVIKDLAAMEDSLSGGCLQTAVIVLTNDKRYWLAGRPNTADSAFRFHEQQTLGGQLGWSSTTSEELKRNRQGLFALRGSYLVQWHNYFRLSDADGGAFRFTVLQCSSEGAGAAR